MKKVLLLFAAAAILYSCQKTHYYYCHCWYYDNQRDSFLWENKFAVESDYDAASGYDATALCYDAYGGAGGINGSSLGCADAVPMDRKAAKAMVDKQRFPEDE